MQVLTNKDKTMKTTTLLTAVAAIAVTFGLSACTDAEMAQIDRVASQASQSGDEIDNASNMQQMERDCKNFVSSQIDSSIPMAAISVSPGYNKGNGKVIIPVSINWDEPRVEETGKCVIVNGVVKKYKAKY